MNNAKSTALGWGVLIAAAGVSFYYAKRGIDERRREQHASGQRPAEIRDWRQRIEHPVPQRTNKDETHSYTKSPSPQDSYKAANPGKD